MKITTPYRLIKLHEIIISQRNLKTAYTKLSTYIIPIKDAKNAYKKQKISD